MREGKVVNGAKNVIISIITCKNTFYALVESNHAYESSVNQSSYTMVALIYVFPPDRIQGPIEVL